MLVQSFWVRGGGALCRCLYHGSDQLGTAERLDKQAQPLTLTIESVYSLV